MAEEIDTAYSSITMVSTHEIRADYDRDTITVYQAYGKEIAIPTLRENRFQPPFSLNRMTWIKPSFLWIMERSGWATKSNQEYILGIKIKRTSWEKALSLGVLTSFDKRVYSNHAEWQTTFDNATIHIQWDPERSLRGAKLEYRSIQVGVSRHLIKEYVNDWTVDIKDYTPLAKKIRSLCKEGHHDKAKLLLPAEKNYPLSDIIKKRIGSF